MSKKIFSLIFFIIFAAALIGSGYFLFGDYYWSWKIGRDYEKWEQEYLDFLKSDTYGGKTPEETYVKFVDTLRAGDIEKASKYFYWEDQEKERQRFQKMKDEGTLEEYVNNFPEWEEMNEEEHWDKNIKRFAYEVVYETERRHYDPLMKEEVVFPTGKGKVDIDFYFNKQAGIWKIYSL